jgi:Flp pilus assembly protein TadD
LDTIIAAYVAGIASRPSDLILLTNLGKANLAKNNLPEARRLLSGVLLANPDADAARLPLVSVALLEGKPGEALQNADQILTRVPRDPRTRYLRTVALMGLARYDEARETLDSMVREFPTATDLQLEQGLLAIMSKRYSEAERIFGKISATGADDVRVAQGLAESYVGQQQLDRAVKVLEAEVSKNPQVALPRQALAKVLVRAAKYDAAIAHLEELRKQLPKSTQVLLDLGDAYRMKGDHGRAEEQFRAALQMTPSSSRANILMGYSLFESGRLAESIPAYRQALSLQPRNSVAMNNLAYALAEKGGQKELDEALQLAQKALEISPKEPDLLDTLGWVYLKKSMPDSAVQVFAGLTHEWPNSPTYLHHMGVALLAKGDSPAARKSLQDALAAGPQGAQADQIRKDLGRISARN